MMKALAPFCSLLLGLSALANDPVPRDPSREELEKLGGFEPLPKEPTPPPQPVPIKVTAACLQVELVVFTVPDAEALTLLPQLRDPAQIDRAWPTVLDLLKKKRARLVAWPVLPMQSGARAVMEALKEYRYGTDFEPSGMDGLFPPQPALPPPPKGEIIVRPPISFETRNLGVTLEIKANAVGHGETIEAAIAVTHNHLVSSKDTISNPGIAFGGGVAAVTVSEFANNRTSTRLVLRSGRPLLLASFPALDRLDSTEFSILRVTTQPLPKLRPVKPAKAAPPRQASR